jgi:uncharacterized protein with HEPN domain
MSKRVDAVYLLDMLTYARRIRERLGDATREDFETDLDLRESIVLNLIFIGEAASKLSQAARSAHAEIAWTQISDMRNRIVHGYFDIDVEKVWIAATEDVPALIATLEKLDIRPGQ